jgi:AcrR family transcriptional regulator
MAKARRRRAPRLSPTERRAALVAVAARVMLRRGYAATQVSHVVREAGVSRGTFYRHFESKRQLLAALARDLLDRILPGFDRPPDVSSRDALAAALQSIARRAFETVARDRPIARHVLGGGAASEPAAIRRLAAHDATWRTLVERLARARACSRTASTSASPPT